MSHESLSADKITQRLHTILPEHVRDDAPAFSAFLSAYFEFLEREVITLKSQSDLDGIALEDGQGALLVETATVSPSPDENSSKIINESTPTNPNVSAEPLTVGEYVYGKENGSIARIDVINGDTLYVSTVSGNGFSKNEVIEGRNSLQSAVVESYKENSILANNRLLDYSDIDHTTEEFLQYFQKDFLPSIDLSKLKNKRLTIKNISDLYQRKGSEESIKFLMRLLYGQDAEVRYPDNETIYVSESNYNEERRLVLQMPDEKVPAETDRLTYLDSDGKTILAEANIERINTLATNIYSCSISRNHYGTFVENTTVNVLDRDGITSYTGTVLGVNTGINTSGGSSTYVGQFNDDDGHGILLAEDGSGILMEKSTIGSLYSMNDNIIFTGSKDDAGVVDSTARVDILSDGPVKEIIVEAGGINYEAGEMVVFDETNTGGNSAEGIIGATGDEIILENATLWGQFEFIATAGQTLFGGAGVKDVNGRYVFFNDHTVKVYRDGLIQTDPGDGSVFTLKNDRVTFAAGQSAGTKIEIVTESNRLLHETGKPITLDAYDDGGTIVSDDGRIRRVEILNGGVGYQQVPEVSPGGYLYFDKGVAETYTIGETVTGSISNATAIVLRTDAKNKRIVVKRSHTDPNAFQTNEQITGSLSLVAKINRKSTVATGTGAKLLSYSDEIGGAESINIIGQGYNFDSDGIVSSESDFPMLISTPSATPTRDTVITGATSATTAKVVSYNAARQVLTYTNLSGEFLEGETITYNVNDKFSVFKSDPISGRGRFAGEGNINEGLLGDKGTLDASAANIQDGYYYQTHSYVVKVGESINSWRSVLKDLIHPSGHIFFGEVAINSSINTVADEQFRFRPTLIMNLDVGIAVPNAFANSSRVVNLWTTDSEVTAAGAMMQLLEAGIPGINVDTSGILNTTDTTNSAGQSLGARSEFYDTSHRSRHINLNIINSFATVTTNHAKGSNAGLPTALSLDSSDHDYLIRSPERRPADQGKIFQLGSLVDEQLILEDGGLIELEEEVCKVRMEPDENARVKGDYGDVFTMEDGSIFRLESATTDEPVHYFTTERSIELAGKYLRMEDNERICMEDGDILIDEENSENGIVSFVPLGSRFNTINTISEQDTYRISYHMRQESGNAANNSGGINIEGQGSGTNPSYNGDNIIMEDNSGSVLMEESIKEGLRISDLETYYPKFYVSEYDNHRNLRTNLTFNAYVKSATT